MKVILSIFLVASIVLFSCEEKPKETDELFEKVMDVHDEIMPKMDEIMKLKKQLKAKVEELNSAAEIDSAKISDLEQAITNLDNSYDEMMGWMHQFDRNFEGMVEEEILKYLNNQMSKIKKVGEVTNAALQDAQEKLVE